MADKHPGYMTTFKERLSYWTYFIGQNIYYNITAAFISTYLAMQGVNLAKVAIVLLIVKIWDAVNDPIFGFIFDKVKFKNGQKSLPWLRISTALIPVVTIILFSIPSALGETGKLVWFGVAYVVWDTVYPLTDIPAYAMLNTMTDNLPERNTLLSVNRVFSGVGVLIYGDEGEGTLKRYIQRGNCVVLQPFNPAYNEMVIKGEDLNHLHIAGRVVETKAKW